MSSNINVKTKSNTKDGVSFTTTNSSSSNANSAESSHVVFKSTMMKAFQNQLNKLKTFQNFDDLEAEYNEDFKEIKDYFIMTPIGNERLYQSVCISYLSELNMKFDDEVKTKLYSAVILDNKNSIVNIKNNKIIFENVYKANGIHNQMELNLSTLSDEMMCMSENFESEIINKISSERTSAEDIKKLQLFISTILDANNEPMMKNIGKNRELKIKYIKLAGFLLQNKNLGKTVTNYEGLSQSLITHLSKIIALREMIVMKLTEWIRYICGDLYGFVHQLEGLKVDQKLLEKIEGQIEYRSGDKSTTNSRTVTEENVSFFLTFF